MDQKSAQEIIDVADSQNLKRGLVQGFRSIAERGDHVSPEHVANVCRALMILLESAEHALGKH